MNNAYPDWNPSLDHIAVPQQENKGGSLPPVRCLDIFQIRYKCIDCCPVCGDVFTDSDQEKSIRFLEKISIKAAIYPIRILGKRVIGLNRYKIYAI